MIGSGSDMISASWSKKVLGPLPTMVIREPKLCKGKLIRDPVEICDLQQKRKETGIPIWGKEEEEATFRGLDLSR